MSADLHTHTLYSDGVLSPEQLLIKAKERGITILSITDHDTMDGYVVGEAIAEKYGIELISGIELIISSVISLTLITRVSRLTSIYSDEKELKGLKGLSRNFAICRSISTLMMY